MHRRTLYCVSLILLFSVSSPALERNADFRRSSLAAEGGAQLPAKLYHYTGEGNVANILEKGLGYDRPLTWTTPAGNLSPVQAQIELAIPANRGYPGALFEIDTARLQQLGINPHFTVEPLKDFLFGHGNGTCLIADGGIGWLKMNSIPPPPALGVDMMRCGPTTGAGGIGGLLARTDANGSAFYHADDAGNVTALIDSSEDIVGRYLYGPFGNTVGRWGSLAAANAMQSSSMPHHNPSGLILYPFRPYEPNFQRFTSSDPIGERGGINLYRFVGNNPISNVDPYGLAFGDWWDLRSYSSGYAQLQGQQALQAQLSQAGYGSPQEFQLDYPGYGGTQTAGDIGAIQAVAKVAAEATDGYLTVAQVIVPGGIAAKEGVEALQAARAAIKCKNGTKVNGFTA